MERLDFLDAAVVVEHGPRAGVGEQATASLGGAVSPVRGESLRLDPLQS